MEILTFNDDNDVVSDISLDGTLYKFRMLWNPDGYFWVFHLWDRHDNVLLANVKVVPNFPLLFNKHCFNIPSGEFIVITKQTVIDRNAFADGRATLVYLTEEEWFNGTV